MAVGLFTARAGRLLAHLAIQFSCRPRDWRTSNVMRRRKRSTDTGRASRLRRMKRELEAHQDLPRLKST
eukprot:1558572-Pleurochrysis_carterae.AAC.1